MPEGKSTSFAGSIGDLNRILALQVSAGLIHTQAAAKRWAFNMQEDRSWLV